MKNYCLKRFVAFILGLILAFSIFPVKIMAFEQGSEGILSDGEFFSVSSRLISENWDDDFVESIPPTLDNIEEFIEHIEEDATQDIESPISLLEARIGFSGTYSTRVNHVNFEDIQELSPEMQRAIRELASQNIVFGTERNRFNPEAPISRAEIAAITMGMLHQLDPLAVSNFDDVRQNDWFYASVSSAYTRRIMQGNGRYFYPSLIITRSQLTSVAARILRNEGFSTPSNPNQYLSWFTDRNDIESWSVEDISLATQAGIVTLRADGRLLPNAPVTKGEAALMLHRTYLKIFGFRPR